ncbi:hypothetical protein [Methylophilus sp. Leaf414]|uniref:hypothetical protein n=1 Tax=Methylophilus sp. Leaf414 TaxID=1736371 RepID=UPI0006F30F70|nr:hypothetical protein [Methylophilus sp. Leaf414]KQT37670.1 hypothetical protein ASG24_01355 [Methylophilus sp. Leaf414]
MDPAILKKTESAMMYGGAIVSFLSGIASLIAGISLSNWGVILGIFISLSGFWMKWREHRMKEIEHKLHVERTNAEILEIKTRTIAVDRAAVNQVSYHTAPPALEAMKNPQDGQAA